MMKTFYLLLLATVLLIVGLVVVGIASSPWVSVGIFAIIYANNLWRSLV